MAVAVVFALFAASTALAVTLYRPGTGSAPTSTVAVHAVSLVNVARVAFR